MSTPSDDDKLLYEVLKLVLTALLAGGATGKTKRADIDRREGALNTCNGYIYEGQSPAYYEGFREQTAMEKR